MEQGLVNLVCQTLPEEEIQSCTEFIIENWCGMAPAMFASDSEIPTDLCIGLGFCEPLLDKTVSSVELHLITTLKIAWNQSLLAQSCNLKKLKVNETGMYFYNIILPLLTL